MVAAANMVEIAALVGDTARATMLAALMGGQAQRTYAGVRQPSYLLPTLPGLERAALSHSQPRGRRICRCCLERGWLVRQHGSRAIRLTAVGRRGLARSSAWNRPTCASARALCGSHYTRKAKSFLSRSGIAARIEISGAPDVAFCFMRSLCRPANGNWPESAGACRHFRSCFSSERRRNVSTGAAVGLSAS